MKVDDDCIGLLAERAGGEFLLGGLERIVEIRVHEHPAHDVADEHARAVARDIEACAATRRALGIVGRPKETVLARGEGERLALVPDMIAGGHDIGAGRDRLAKDLFGDAEAAGRVLAVDDHEIQPEVGDQARQPFPDRRAACLAHHVAKKKKPHEELVRPGEENGKFARNIPPGASYYRPGPNLRNPLSVSISGRIMSCGSSGTISTCWQSKATPTRRGA